MMLGLLVTGVVSPAQAGNTVGGIVQNAVTANGNGTAITTFGTFLVASYVISGTFVATVNFEGSGQDGSFQSLGCVPITSGATVSSATTTGAWRCNIVGMIQIRARVSGYTSGSVTVSIQASDTGTVLVGPSTDTVSASTLTNPTITGTVTGTPTWNSAQTFPGIRVNGGIGVNRAPPTTAGQYAATNAANSGTMVTLTRNTDTSPVGNFLNFQNAAASSLFTVSIAGLLTQYGGGAPSDGQLLIGGTSAATFATGTLTAGSNIVVTNGNNSVTVATSANPTFATSVTIGGSTPTALTNVRVYSSALTPTQMAASIAFAEQTFTVTGLTTADKVVVNPGGAQGTQCAFVGAARVSAADTLALTFFNSAASLCTPASSTYAIIAVRS